MTDEEIDELLVELVDRPSVSVRAINAIMELRAELKRVKEEADRDYEEMRRMQGELIKMTHERNEFAEDAYKYRDLQS